MKNSLKRVVSLLLIISMITGGFVGCTTKEETKDNSSNTSVDSPKDSTDTTTSEAQSVQEDGGTIMWLSNLSSGVAYETAVNYATMICEELGYEFQVVYGDPYNDPAGNLSAVKNGMTKDVVALIASQDGGIKDIMAEFPELYVAGYNTDMLSVFGEGAAAAELLNNDRFLGTICDGEYDGRITGQQMAAAVIEKGYKKISTIMFPGFAYPNLVAAEASFREEIARYNDSTESDIEIVGDTKVLEFQPLEEAWFLEGRDDLDGIVAFCAGVLFVYPTMKSAIVNGSCSPNTKLITGGFDTDEAIVADIGDEGVIQYLNFSPTENIAWSLIMIDNAIGEKMYSDFPGAERIASIPYVIDSKMDIENVMTKSMNGTADVTLTQLGFEEIKGLLTRFTPDAQYSDLKTMFLSNQLSVDALMLRE
ncbi:MAG: sugar ABC transporter substrate-binding protein [Vallitaleaceae bacterium]|nr:sugar ABC transporter substrate-binding protein [Vallitaleaceae bacterium]